MESAGSEAAAGTGSVKTWPGVRRRSLRARVLVPILAAMVAIFLFLGTALFVIQQRRQDASSAVMLDSAGKIFDSHVQRSIAMMKVDLDFVAADLTLQGAFRKRDRDALLRLAQPLFSRLKETQNITHWYFHTPERVCFLRVMRPDEHGDVIERATLKEAQASGQCATGIEPGKLGYLTLRVVVPWRDEQGLLGYLELGMEIDSVITRIKSILGAEVVVSLEKRLIHRESWESVMRGMGRTPEWNLLKDEVVVDRTLPTVPEALLDRFSDRRHAHGTFVRNVTSEGSVYAAAFVPIRDLRGASIGDFALLFDISEERRADRRMVAATASAALAVGGGVFAFLFVILGRIDRRSREHEAVQAETNIALIEEVQQRQRAEVELRASEERYRSVYETAPLAFVVWDAQCRIMDWNRKAEEIFGWKREEVLGRNFLELIVPEAARPAVENVVASLVDGTMALRSENENVTRAGRVILCEWNNAVLRGRGGEIEAVLSLGLDVTEHRRMEGLLRQAKEEWEETFDIINDAITIHDSDYTVVRANRAAGELLNIPALKVEHRKCFEVYHGSSGPPPCCKSCETMRNGGVSVQEIYEPSLKKHLEIKALPRVDHDGRIVGIVHIVRDITARVAVTEEKERLEQQLRQAQKMESIGRLAGGLAHDFNNILTAIIGYGQLGLKLAPRESPVVRHLGIIVESGERAAVLVRQLLAFGRKQVMRLENVALDEVVRKSAKLIERIVGEDVAFSLRLESGAAHVHVDPHQIEQVLLNLAVNARDAMPEGGTLAVKTLPIEVPPGGLPGSAGLQPGRYVELTVSDTGVGMSPEVREKIFEPFFTTKESGKGTGLGLATAYGIVKQHGGFIYVTSEPGLGSRFKIYLPVVEPQVVEATAPAEEAPRRGGRETIMVVEDDQAIRGMVLEVLEPLGYTILEAANGEEAVSQLERFHGKIDLLLTDVVLPGRTGKAVAATYRARHAVGKVVFFSGYNYESLGGRGILDEGVTLLEKPLAPARLIETVRAILDGGPPPEHSPPRQAE